MTANQLWVTDGVGLVATYLYDAEGNRLKTGDEEWKRDLGWRKRCDALNRLVTATDPLGKTTTTQYDPVGNPLSSTDRNGNVTTYTYDAINRRITSMDALANTTQLQYDPVGNLIKLTDANLHALTTHTMP